MCCNIISNTFGDVMHGCDVIFVLNGRQTPLVMPKIVWYSCAFMICGS
jgi:hypothetical protein